MLRSLAVIACALTLVAHSQVPRDRDSKHNPANNESNSSATCLDCIQVQESSPKKQSEPENKPYQWSEFGAPANVINAVLAGAAIWAGCMALGTLKAIKEQTKETARAAKATESTVKLMERQTTLQLYERRGIIKIACEPVGIDYAENDRFLVGTLKVTNIGNSSLQIRGGNGGLFLEKFENDLVEVLGEQREIYQNNCWIRSKNENSFQVFCSPEINEELWKKLSIVPTALFIRGEIKYNSMGYNWIRRYAFRWIITNPRTMEILDGYWEEDPHHSNEEDELVPDCLVPF